VLSLALRRVLANMLFGVAPGDPIALIAAVMAMALAALAGAYLPARRAARITPLAALRVE
jgi:ABC-type antimicrobial peptide transport system permease subunit